MSGVGILANPETQFRNGVGNISRLRGSHGFVGARKNRGYRQNGYLFLLTVVQNASQRWPKRLILKSSCEAALAFGQRSADQCSDWLFGLISK